MQEVWKEGIMLVHCNVPGSDTTLCYELQSNVYTTNNKANINCTKCLEKLTKEVKMIECEFCKTPLPEGHPALIAQAIDKNISWSSLESDDNRFGKPVGASLFITELNKQVTIVAKKFKPTMDEVESGYYEEGEYPQGTIYKAYIVLQCEDKFFKKVGTADSYGDVTWDEPLRVAEAVTKTVVEYR
jgi:hypothetical protein